MATRASQDPLKAAERLRAYIVEHELQNIRVAEMLESTPQAVWNWLRGQPPSEPYREAIERLTANWTRGPIKASEWGETPREREVSKKLARVKPFPGSR